MTNSEFSNEFDILYNNIMSNQAPGLNEYEKSVFLTKAQDEIVKAYFSPNKAMEGFDGSEKRQIDFSSIIKATRVKELKLPGSSTEVFDQRSYIATLPKDKDILMIINETLEVTRGTGGSTSSTPSTTGDSSDGGDSNTITLTVIPISYTEYNRLMSKPYKRPLKNQAWRLLVNNNSSTAELIAGNSDTPIAYNVRYIKRPRAIVLTALEGVTVGGVSALQECELDPILHHEILQRAVELAKAAYTGDLQSQVSLGQASQTDIGKSLRQ
jgi:hypothetical protein